MKEHYFLQGWIFMFYVRQWKPEEKVGHCQEGTDLGYRWKSFFQDGWFKHSLGSLNQFLDLRIWFFLFTLTIKQIYRLQYFWRIWGAMSLEGKEPELSHMDCLGWHQLGIEVAVFLRVYFCFQLWFPCLFQGKSLHFSCCISEPLKIFLCDLC